MERVRIGGAPDETLEISRLGFGAWAAGGLMWGGCDAREAEDAIRASLDAGVSLVDTAPAYGCGRSEEIVGRAIRGRRHEVVVATKCGLRWDRRDGALRFEVEDPEGGGPVRIHYSLRPESLREECEASLRRLGVETIDLYQIHWPYPPHPLADALGELARLREAGKVRAVGVSNVSVAQLEEARACGGVASVQPPYSLVDRRVEADVLPWCRAHGVGVLAYSPMGRGLLTGRVDPDRVFPPSDHRGTNPAFARAERLRVRAAIEATRDVARAHGATPGQLAVAWVLARPVVSAALVGARSPAQARENLGAAALSLSPEEIERLSASFPQLPWKPSRPSDD